MLTTILLLLSLIIFTPLVMAKWEEDIDYYQCKNNMEYWMERYLRVNGKPIKLTDSDRSFLKERDEKLKSENTYLISFSRDRVNWVTMVHNLEFFYDSPRALKIMKI